MPPKQSTSAPRGRPPKTNTNSTAKGPGRPRQKAASAVPDPSPSPPPDISMISSGSDDDDEDARQNQIPPELLTRLLHEFFEKDGTRVSRDANGAVAKYVDVFVREAIARAATEREGGFLEVEDLEKIAPQLLLDL